MTTKTEPAFIDTNILVHRSVESSAKYGECAAFLDGLDDTDTDMVISGQVIREFIRTLTRPQRATGDALSHPEAIRMAEGLRHAYRVLPENELVHERFLQLVSNFKVSGKQVHDANIVATMLAHNVKLLVTENTADFKRYGGLIRLINPMNLTTDGK